MARMPDGPPPPPVVQRLRLQYAKTGRLRFSSHRDFQRALERAIRRSATPIAFSAGFNPHPKVSYANAAPTGAASHAEYIELALAEVCDPDRLREALDTALPAGLDIVDCVEAGPGALADRLEASCWQIVLNGVEPDLAQAAAAALMATQSLCVVRVMKQGPRDIDVRAALISMTVTSPVDARVGSSPATPCAILTMVVRHTTPAVRPDDVLAALRTVADLAPPSPPVATRLAQGPLDEASGTVSDPLDADRTAAASRA